MQAFAFYKLAFVLHSIMKEKQTLKLFYNSLSLRILTFPFCNRSLVDLLKLLEIMTTLVLT